MEKIPHTDNMSFRPCQPKRLNTYTNTLGIKLKTEISQFIDKPWEAFAALKRKFEALTEDDIPTLEGKMNRITQERNESYASLISHLNMSFVKFKNAGGSKTNNNLCAIL
ncbi:hypothetical protein SARC_06673 [Sphaeroforma arctica JP610]|uniref:Uncharacterized protein n=1 Tax=Sphaeroforma arctica JP610 TaxID=667725 RepID=A0A0L0FVW5_9EUKA|nr:hypothetical protein SARC_06673 [Sphaeroforma arctica JP610]KNC80982.1 hypothetical protein SARC_06673 [Sphaeroforma arctica JP610]|eukprot:XP_014154884.1 hypothetical protein SARC_06673 [Sphaeroforma arctica JP610]